MVKLSDYLNYLNNEVIQARKKADEQAIEIAKEYAKHEYLKYFKVPRFSMPVIKMNIPIKINQLDTETKYDFDRDYDLFIAEANEKITKVNQEKQLNIKLLVKEELLENKELISVFDKLELEDRKPVKNISESLSTINKDDISKTFVKNTFFSTATDASTQSTEEQEYTKILLETFESRHKIVETNINDIFIEPDTSSTDTENEKLFLHLEVEMQEENLQIRSVTDKDGNKVEQIIFD